MRFFVSTAIDYVNAPPHLGHCLEKIQADVIARYQRSLGEKVFFLSGTDENSLKNVKAAKKQNLPIEQLVDRNAQRFYQLKEILNLSFDDFIRTTEKRHILAAQKLWRACQKDIYKKKYQGLYCIGCEEFYRKRELKNGLCPEHQTKPELVEEENYFFQLSKYQARIKKILENNEIEIIPPSRKNEVLTFIDQGLDDICISRSAQRGEGWGIEVPGDPSQRQWVWFDALSNYISALGYGKESKEFQQFWQDNNQKLHIIGKGILRFHAIYWPGILLSAHLSLPEKIFVHGYLTLEGRKMSKSLGNIVDPFFLVKKYGTDPVRYFLLREFSPIQDGDFSYQKLEKRYQGELAFGLGNLVARVITLAQKTKVSSFPSNQTSFPIKKELEKTWQNYHQLLKNFKFNETLGVIWRLIGFGDKYIEENRPWEKRNHQLLVINDLLVILKELAQMLKPFLPETSEKILVQLENRNPQPLFPRLES